MDVDISAIYVPCFRVVILFVIYTVIIDEWKGSECSLNGSVELKLENRNRLLRKCACETVELPTKSPSKSPTKSLSNQCLLSHMRNEFFLLRPIPLLDKCVDKFDAKKTCASVKNRCRCRPV